MATITGTEGPDTLTGTADADTIDGKGGNDVLYGKFGDDLLKGGAGDDMLYGDDGRDILMGGEGNDLLNGGAYIDTASFADAANGVHVDATKTGPQDTGEGIDTLRVESLIGSSYNDVLYSSYRIDGGAGDDYLYAVDDGVLTRNHALYGGDGNDVLVGENSRADDYLDGGTGADSLYGGLGDDTSHVDRQ
jgi:Ca2+-binding RTX toxin-like protein